MSVSVHRTDGERLPETLKDKLITAAHILLKDHHLEQGDLAIVLTDDTMLQELNRCYRGIDSPTDVLSFPMLEPYGGEDVVPGDCEGATVGDIYISLQRVYEQAGSAGHSWEREALILSIHGLLHILGYDHDSSVAADEMQQKEVEVLNLVDQPTG
ncbi:MAG: rRNA maturation RNase YbeY [Firmicutes bacterium]|nr:rRNA maturation RNase YbeY [Bacillota bacterium]